MTRNVPLTRGLGRAYGDAALPSAGDLRVAGSVRADRILSFDRDTGDLTAEAGFTLEQLYSVFLPRGFFTPVSPGTRFVTLGGMVASDVHGKNHHHAGTIGRHVHSLKLRVADGRIVTCSRLQHPDLFRATLGGMGLTGHLLDVTVRLTPVPSSWIVSRSERVPGIDALVEALTTASREWPMTAGWIDCLARPPADGRGILVRGRWAERHEARKAFPQLRRPVDIPFTMPERLLNTMAVRSMNAFTYSRHGQSTRTRLVEPQRFFYPLDAIGQWNRLYGRRGLMQYQCLLPDGARAGAVRRLFDVLTRHGAAVFLCVIKDCGSEGEGLLSFPRPGMSVALDIPMRTCTPSLVDALNELVIQEGGRIYLAKDALTHAAHFRAMDQRVDAFLRVRREWDPEGRIRSAQSVRLFGW